MPRVAIIGTGLIGASIGLRLRSSGALPDLEVVGYDRERDHQRRARTIGALDREADSAAAAVAGAAVVILAVPALALRQLLEEIAPALVPGAVVTDTASTKGEVMVWAQQALPPTVAFVGGHPMAGKTEAGPASAGAALFEGARWVIVPSPGASETAVETVRKLVEIMGARTMFMDASEHDAYVAAISHLPLLAAHALFSLTRGSEAWPELSLLAAGGFRDATRLTGTEPNMAFDIIQTNREQIVHWLTRYRAALRDLQQLIERAGSEEELFRALAQANWDYSTFIEGAVGRTEVDEKSGTALPSGDFARMMLGDAMTEKMRQIGDANEARLAELERRQRLTRRE
ncbi:MAG: prephenate dehydrogenase/arogenate dehydrogenase family protein [Dehalococcoidia bacterium]|nr:prephenate dehydrogenase/arogenate dehydrogenase family protein [Dehalococcoidia bacterium]